jgi:carboxymethylenebutenolidase
MNNKEEIAPMDRRIIELYDEYTHAPLPRRVFLRRLAALTGSSAAAFAVLPMLENNYAQAAIVAPGDPRVAGSMINYPGASGGLRAYLAVPTAGPAKRAGVIVIHENRGLNPHIEDVARRLAVAGFTALAPDLLSPLGGTPADQDSARSMIARVDRVVAARDLVAAIPYLKARPDSNGKVGAVGFCWGGGMTNQLAVAAPDLDAAVPFYGPVPSAEDAAKIKAQLMLHYAGNDSRINAGVPTFEAALKAAGVNYQMYTYENAEHSFNNDTAGPRYNKEAAELAWSRTIDFLKKRLS